MKAKVVTWAGKAKGNIDLDDDVFGIALDDLRKDLLHRMVRYQLAKRRAGTHKVKERGEVARTGKKFGRQKGGGGARHGSRRANIFVGGGVSHGPRPRSYAHDLPKKVRRLALAHALSSRAGAERLVILDDDALETPKTADLRKALSGLKISDALVITGAEVNENLRLAGRNLDKIDVLPVQGLNVYDVLRHDTLVLTRTAVDAVHARFRGDASAAVEEAA